MTFKEKQIEMNIKVNGKYEEIEKSLFNMFLYLHSMSFS
jgi:hypothetical protein